MLIFDVRHSSIFYETMISYAMLHGVLLFVCLAAGQASQDTCSKTDACSIALCNAANEVARISEEANKSNNPDQYHDQKMAAFKRWEDLIKQCGADPLQTSQPAKPPDNCGLTVNGTDPRNFQEIPVTINADTLKDFIDKVNALEGGVHTSFNPTSSTGPDDYDDKGRLLNPHIDISAHIQAPMPGLSKAGEYERALMKKAGRMCVDHEQEHYRAQRDILQKAACSMIGKPKQQADRILHDAVCNQVPRAQQKIDMHSGLLDWVRDKDGKIVDAKDAPWPHSIAAYTPQSCKDGTF